MIKIDKKTGLRKIWIYKDKTSGEGKGEATVTYEDEAAASAAIEWFNGTILYYLLHHFFSFLFKVISFLLSKQLINLILRN